ncbi:MAG: hypothetical protein GWP91_02660, partial [Rhodobacterales bacterium]|nr:hypothetical protein [Rhodobacterales bacterium]
VEFFRHSVERVESGDIDPDEIKLLQLRLNRSSGVGNQSVEQMAGRVGGAIISDDTWEEVEQKGDRIAAVSAADLTRLVEGCLDHAWTSMEGPKDVVTEQLDAKGYAYEIIDHEELGEAIYWEKDPKGAKKWKKAKDKADAKKEEAEAKEKAEAGDSEEDASEE